MLKKRFEPIKEIIILIATLATFACVLFSYGMCVTACAVGNYLRCSHCKE